MLGWIGRLFGRGARDVAAQDPLRATAADPPPPPASQVGQPAPLVELPEAPPPPRQPARSIMFVDVETTGFMAHDRVVSLATLTMIADEPQKVGSYLIFDPRRNCHPDAARIHGWDDWTLRFQDLFADLAAEVHSLLCSADLLVMHNAEFDLRMLNREFRKAGLPPLPVPAHCTMLEARERWPGERAGLDACLARIGLARSGATHTAFEDVFLTMNLHRFFRGAERPFRLLAPVPMPTNYRPPPPRPDGPLPRRTPKRPKVRPQPAPV